MLSRHGMDSRTRLRRVSQRPGQAYSRRKQVIPVTPGRIQAVWNLTQKNLVGISTAATFRPVPRIHSAPNRTAKVNGRAPGTPRRCQAKTASPINDRTVRNVGKIWGV